MSGHIHVSVSPRGGVSLEVRPREAPPVGVANPRVLATAGELALTGPDAEVVPGEVKVPMSVGALTLTGQQAGIVPGGVGIPTGAGALALAGQNADVVPGGVGIPAASGGLALAGVPARTSPWITADDFLTNEGAPIVTPRICEPGPGILKASDPQNLYISDGEVFNTRGWEGSIRAAQAHIVGNATVVFFRVIQGNEQGFTIRTSDSAPIRYDDGRLGQSLSYIPSLYEYNDANSTYYTAIPLAPATAADGMACVVDNDGRFRLYVREGSTGIWGFHWITQYPLGLSTYWPTVLYNAGSGVGELALSKWRGGVIQGVNQETLKVASAISGVDYQAVADFTLFLIVTAPNPLAGYCELRYRVLDDENYCRIRLHDTGALTFDTVANGNVTNRQTVANAVAAGETVKLALSTRDNQHRAGTYGVPPANRARFLPVTQSHYDTQTVLCPVVSGDWTLGEMIVYPRFHSGYQLLNLGEDGGGGAPPDGLMMAAALGGAGVYG